MRRAGADGDLTYFVYDTDGRIVYEERVAEAAYTEFVYGGSQLFARILGTIGGDGSDRETQFYLTDHLGTTVMLTDAGGELLWRRD